MKYIILMSVFMTGCMYQDVTAYDISRSGTVCKEHGGIYEITVHAVGLVTCRCTDGYKFKIDSNND